MGYQPTVIKAGPRAIIARANDAHRENERAAGVLLARALEGDLSALTETYERVCESHGCVRTDRHPEHL